MFFRKLITATLAAASTVSALPGALKARQSATISDVDVLNFACLLEDLENKFYNECTTRFSRQDFIRDGLDGGLFDEMLLINDHENTHFVTLQQTIQTVFGNNAIAPECAEGCSYKFGLRSPRDCVNIGSILELTGVSAYSGAIRFIENPDLKNAGAAIATIEGRHTAFLNENLRKLPVPNGFDTPLGVRPVFSLAAQFVDRCPRDIPIVPFPLITVTDVRNQVAAADVGEPLIASFSGSINENDLRDARVALVFGLAQKNVNPIAIRRAGADSFQVEFDVPEDVRKFGDVVVFIVNGDKQVSVADDSAVIAGPGLISRRNVVVDIVQIR